MTNIFIRETFKNDYTTRDAGEKLRHMILLSKKKIMLDFSDIKIASASFFDEGIAKLSLEGWDSKKLNDQLEFKNLFITPSPWMTPSVEEATRAPKVPPLRRGNHPVAYGATPP